MSTGSYPYHGLRGQAYQLVYEQLFTIQAGKCAICGHRIGDLWRPPIEQSRIICLMIDHSHVTGEIRGLLCVGCNSYIAHYEKRVGDEHRLKWVRAWNPTLAANVEAYLYKPRLWLEFDYRH